MWNWKERICSAPNPGDSWCICMWASANIVAEVGCHNFEINCSATDVNYVLNSRYDGGWNLQNFKSCLKEKCERQSDGKYLIELRTIILNILLQGIWSEIGNIMLLCKI